MIENRHYLEDSTSKEVEAIIARVTVLDDNKFNVRELPQVTPFSINLIFDTLDQVTEGVDDIYLLVDLSEGGRPDAASRRVLNTRFNQLSKKINHCSFVTGKNVLVNTALRFILFGTGLKSYSVDSEYEVGLNKLNNAN